ncbi:MAG TPA: hypothetical protein VKZ94_01360 [Advenella sp.]|nr:hypothetical protein [Advenella sp.]
MKFETVRTVTLAAILAGMLGLAGCDKGADSAAPETPPATSEAPATEPAAPADSGTTPAPSGEAPASGGSQPQ